MKSTVILISFLFITNVFGQIQIKDSITYKLKSLKNVLDWKEVGPLTYPGTEKEYGYTGVGPVGGFQIHPKNHQFFALYSVLGGLFLSRDEGNTWKNSGSDKWERSSCSSLNFHPIDHNTIVALSIEEAMPNGGTIGFKGGVMLTQDFGRNWRRIATYKDFSSDQQTWISKVLLTGSNQCFVATRRGLYYLEDINDFSAKWVNLLKSTDISDIQIIGGQILVSGNYHGGEVWFINRLELKDPTKHSSVKLGCEAKGLSALKFKLKQYDSDKFFYIAQYKGKADLLLESNLEGNYKVLSTKMSAIFGAGRTLAISYADTNIIFAGHGVGLRKSIDYGKTWKMVRGNFHVDIEGVYFHPERSKEIYIVTHGGLFKSEDLGETWRNWSEGIGNAEVMGISVGYSGVPIAVGLFHDGSLVMDKKGWMHKAVGDGLNSLVSPDDNRYVYISNQHGAGGLLASKDSGATFEYLRGISKFPVAGWSMSFVSNTKDPKTFYFNYKRKREEGLSEGYDVVMSKNRGFSDYHIISDFKSTHGYSKYNLYNLWVNPNMPGTLYAYILLNDSGTLEHKLYKNDSTLSENYEGIKLNWKEVELPLNNWIGDIEFNPLKDEEMFVVYGSKNRYKEDLEFSNEMVFRVNLEKKVNCYSGKNCKDITWSLPNAYIDKLASYIDRKRNRLYVGTNEGVYYLDLEEMDDWVKLGASLPNVTVREITSSGDGKYIYVGTRGRGVWKIIN